MTTEITTMTAHGLAVALKTVPGVHDAEDDLARCIEDAARLAKVRDVLTRWDADVDADDMSVFLDIDPAKGETL